MTYPDGTTATITGNTSHTSNLLTAANCDSIITTNVTMDPIYNITQNVSACQNSTVTYPDGTTATITGNTSHVSNLLTSANCDSIITTNVMMNLVYSTAVAINACQNSTVIYPDGSTTVITGNTSHVSNLLSVLGCDSLVTTNVTMDPTYNLTQNVNACENSTITYPDGTTATITANTSHISNLLTAANCDSIITTNVTMDPIYSITQNINACENSTVTYPDGSMAVITGNTSHISNLLTAANCDSIITTNVTMDPIYNITQNVSACQNSTVTYPDGAMATITANTSHISNLLTAANCDSIITTNVTMNPIYATTVSINACENSTVTYPDGSTTVITANTSHVSNLLSALGCDSLVTTNVTMDPTYNLTQNVNACENSTITYPDGTTATITANTSHISNLLTAANCDSIITTNVTMDPLPISGGNAVITICSNGTPLDLYTQLIGPANAGGTWSPAMISGTGFFDPAADPIGTYTYTVTNPCGTSSSTVQVTLYTNPNPGTNGTLTVCQNSANVDLFTLIGTADAGGIWSPTLASSSGIFNPSLDAGGVYTYSITTNCGIFSSNVQVTLTPLDNANFSYPSTVFCTNDPPVNAIVSGLAGGTFSISGSGIIDATTGQVDVFNSGPGTYAVTYATNGSCPNTQTISITIQNSADATINAAGPFCEDNGPYQLVAATPGGIWSGTGVDSITGIFDPSIAAIGLNTITYTILGSCGDVQTIDISVFPTPTVSTISDTTITLGSSVNLLTVSSVNNFVWSPNEWLSCSTCQNPTSTPQDNVTYTVTASANGCSATDEVTITVLYDLVLFVPNIFSPNGDNNNDVLFVRGKGITDLRFIVYDRWGEKVFESTSLADGWDGTFRGEKMNPAVFVYYVQATFTDGSDVTKKGNVTLIR